MRVAIVEGRFYDEMSDALLEGAKEALESLCAEAQIDVYTVPGALEVPPLLAAVAETKKYDVYVALGIVIRGETSHYDVVVNETSRKLVDLSTDRGLCLGIGLITVENEGQAWARARKTEIDVGGRAARAAYALFEQKKKLGIL